MAGYQSAITRAISVLSRAPTGDCFPDIGMSLLNVNTGHLSGRMFDKKALTAAKPRSTQPGK